MKIRSYAKINIGLDVIRRLENGYHEVRMIMQSLGLCDKLIIEKTDDPGIVINVNDASLPVNEDNLIYKAAKLLIDEFDLPGGLDVELIKNIPIAAGLAGGSGNAAAVMKAVNSLYDLGLSVEDLMKRSVKIGADVPFCIMGGCAISEGIGEVLTPIPSIPKCSILLAKPSVSVSTAYVYNNLKLDEVDHPDIDAIIAGIKAGDIKGITDNMGNVLETVTGRQYPVIGRIEQIMKECGALGAMMSGSGPTVFGIFNTAEAAAGARDELAKSDPDLKLFVTEAVEDVING
ncbi:MAG: 4-(cytidine 5'-diphospho)-2-C-methyl-D-erythritol kinase [Lachnospiraceae bacterium]|nr:4-(cytidine 5'-diphospho)-2-C-methyl-D-erythritol kinase [Lachnospiraceae bacterium]